MFSSTTNPYLFPNLPPSNYHHHHLFSPPPFLCGDATDFFLHHSDLLMADTLFGMVQVSPLRNQQEPNEQNFGPKSSTLTKAKKHKHSKIFTAQGLRDRRVRLSIEMARKFFDLQDMLGFEKASKTIDWLLKNSKTEIKDLLMNNEVKAESSSATLLTSTAPAGHGCEVVSAGNHEDTKMMKKKLIEGKKVKSQKDRVDFYDRYLNASREARARARERARERTREKKKMLRSDQLKGSPISSDR